MPRNDNSPFDNYNDTKDRAREREERTPDFSARADSWDRGRTSPERFDKDRKPSVLDRV